MSEINEKHEKTKCHHLVKPQYASEPHLADNQLLAELERRQEDQLGAEQAERQVLVDAVGVGLQAGAQHAEDGETEQQQRQRGQQADIGHHVLSRGRLDQKLKHHNTRGNQTNTCTTEIQDAEDNVIQKNTQSC